MTSSPPPPDEATSPELTKQSAADQIVQTVKDMILRGDLQPGQLLPPERQLAATLNISRPTLRSALQALSAMNIVQTRHGEGTFVTGLTAGELAQPIRFMLQIDDSAILHLFEVRRTLEGDAARLAAERITADELGHLRSLVRAAATVMNDAERFLTCDMHFHSGIVAAVRNPLFGSIYDSMVDLSLESRRRTAGSLQVRRSAHRDHQRILTALSAHDGPAARLAMWQHLEQLERFYRRRHGLTTPAAADPDEGEPTVDAPLATPRRPPTPPRPTLPSRSSS